MAVPALAAPSLYPESLIEESIRVLVGFRIVHPRKRVRRFEMTGGASRPTDGIEAGRRSGVRLAGTTRPGRAAPRPRQTTPQLDGTVRFSRGRTALFEFEPRDGERQVFAAYEHKDRIRRIDDLSVESEEEFLVPQPTTMAIKPSLVCAVRVFEMADRTPLLILTDEMTDRVVLAIGNIGDRIEWTPAAKAGYHPPWYSQITVL